MAAEVNKPDFSFQWASGGAIVAPSDVKIQTGWTTEVPPFQWENYLQNRQDNAILHLFQKGISEWDAASNYYFTASGTRSYVQGSDGVIYVAVQDSVGQNPTTDDSDTYWKVAFADNSTALTTTTGDARYAQRSNNLSDLGNAATARTNLGVADAVVSGIAGTAANLRLSSTGTSAAVVITADAVCLKTSTNVQAVVNAVSLTATFANAGVNGLDVGAANSQAAGQWYSVWVIWNGTTVSSLLSLSTTSPTLPAGYTHKARVGWVRTDGTGNKYPLRFDQAGGRVTISPLAGTNVDGNIIMASGVQGTISDTGLNVSVDPFIPPTAWALEVFISTQTGSGGTVQVGRTGTLLNSIVMSITNETNQATSATIGLDGTSRNIVYASNLGFGVLGLRGWEDNL